MLYEQIVRGILGMERSRVALMALMLLIYSHGVNDFEWNHHSLVRIGSERLPSEFISPMLATA